MLFSVEQVMVGRDEKRAPLKTLAWEVNKDGRYCEKGLFTNKKDRTFILLFASERGFCGKRKNISNMLTETRVITQYIF